MISSKKQNKKKHSNDLAEKVRLISTKGYSFLLGRMYFTGKEDYQNFLVFASVLGSQTLDNNIKVTN